VILSRVAGPALTRPRLQGLGAGEPFDDGAATDVDFDSTSSSGS
jgi:hypothetical protein